MVPMWCLEPVGALLFWLNAPLATRPSVVHHTTEAHWEHGYNAWSSLGRLLQNTGSKTAQRKGQGVQCLCEGEYSYDVGPGVFPEPLIEVSDI